VTKLRTIGLLGGLAIVLVACSPSASPTDSSPSEAPSEAPSAPASEPASAAPSEAAADGLRIVETAAGTALAGPDGLTLYIHTQEGTGDIVCVEGCLDNWPPLTGDIAAGEANADLLSTVTRPDGIEQVTYNGFPLYYFVGDTAEGNAAGEGISGVWFIANPEGN
jgi:predicted lipoprotein with Yx(FWY)xxD motif